MVQLLTDVGNFRKVNEDYIDYYTDETKRIYVIADGMGGHNAGEIASKLAVENTISYINSLPRLDDLEDSIKKAVGDSNHKIYELSKSKADLNGMGTTLTACLIKGNDMVIAHVGDSRCYIIKDKAISQVTKDHSLVQQLLDEGSITESEADNHPNRNIITRALGTSNIVDVDVIKMDIKGIDKIILCTDGLSNLINEQELYDFVMNNDDCCAELVELSKSRGTKDNISVIVFEGEWRDDR
ncbi:MAG TPA: Stp1/IreP family PP2C-type Ser/Thr phosphatase [Clostridiaceae bacterium]